LGKVKPMTERSTEPFWLISLPVISSAVFICHLPIMLRNLGMLPSWSALDTMFAPLLVWSSISGIAISTVIYTVDSIPKPVKLPSRAIQDFFAYDFYIQRFYQLTIVLLVATSARVTNWFDRYVVDGLVNFVGLGTLFGGQTLRYTTSGQSQFYILVAFTGIVLVGLMMGLFV
jgi:NAD(P)H-quinone oxidoreductase subunit 5